MSEYQYYEFQAIDRPLTEEEQQAVGSLSSRARVTPHQAIFVYNYGNFRGNPREILVNYFDVMLYVTNWGSKQLMFRFPASLVDIDQIGLYCLEDVVPYSANVISYSEIGEHVVLNLEFHDEEGGRWMEGEGWLPSLVRLREDILKQDYRVLYLAWLLAISMLYPEELDEALYEPPVPPGLQQLSRPLCDFVDLFEVDELLIRVASETSLEQQRISEDVLCKAIPKLSREECDTFLTRLVQGKPNVAIEVTRRLSELVGKIPGQQDESRRTAVELLEAVERERGRQRGEMERAAEEKRRKELEALIQEEPQLWQKVLALIAQKQTKAYDEAVQILLNLKNVAVHRGTEADFQEKINQIHRDNHRLSGLRSRLTDRGLSST